MSKSIQTGFAQMYMPDACVLLWSLRSVKVPRKDKTWLCETGKNVSKPHDVNACRLTSDSASADVGMVYGTSAEVLFTNRVSAI